MYHFFKATGFAGFRGCKVDGNQRRNGGPFPGSHFFHLSWIFTGVLRLTFWEGNIFLEDIFKTPHHDFWLVGNRYFFPVNLDLLRFFVCKKFMVKWVVFFLWQNWWDVFPRSLGSLKSDRYKTFCFVKIKWCHQRRKHIHRPLSYFL